MVGLQIQVVRTGGREEQEEIALGPQGVLWE